MTINVDDFKNSLLTLLAEGFGVSDAPDGFFLDDGQAGLLGTIDKLSAATASARLRPQNATIAAHSNHILYLLDVFVLYERGERPAAGWESSWEVQVVDEAAWDALRAAVRERYTAATALVRARTDWPAPAVGGAMLLLAHVAYHAGEIKQIITSLAA
jgi:hypothetical protein